MFKIWGENQFFKWKQITLILISDVLEQVKHGVDHEHFRELDNL
jgi:hypothetical protein